MKLFDEGLNMFTYLSIIIIGLLIINAYIFWLGTKIVPFARSIPRNNDLLSYTIDKLHSGRHIIILYFSSADNSAAPIESVRKDISFSVTIKDVTSDSIVFKNDYFLANMQRTQDGVKYVENMNIGYKYGTTEQTADNYSFRPSLFKKYIMETKISNPDNALYNFNPTIGLFCQDIDDGYFGVQYLVYNAVFILLIAGFAIIKSFFR
jgi:hypothetical protein